MSELPRGWATARLSDLGGWIGGGTPSKANPAFWSGDIPWVSPKDMKVEVIHDAEDHITSEALGNSATNLVPDDSVLVVTRSGILRHSLPVAVTGRPVSLNQDLKALTPHRGLRPHYIAWALRAHAQSILRTCTKGGTTVQSVETNQLLQFEIPIAPTEEQVRIVATIEEQFSRLDAGVAALQRIRQALKRMRAAVLNAAVSGQLTSPNAGRSQGDLPDGWRVCTPRELAQDRKHALAIGPFGSNLKVVDYKDEGVPLVFVRQVRSGSFGGSDTRFISETKARELSAHGVTGGDVLITKMGEPPGDAVVYPAGYPDAVITADVIKVSVGVAILPDYLALAINSRWVRDQFVAITSGVAQQKVSLARFASSIHVPTPPLPEQRKIVAKVGARMEELARLDIAATAGLNHSSALRAAILASAFSGKLVPQNPSDEPASALIDRIAAEQASPQDSKSGKARERRIKATA